MIRAVFIKALLHSGDEVRKFSVLPSVALEVDLDTLAESFPAHQEDELLYQT